MKGILVGNGVMDYEGDGLERAQIDYMFSRNFIDPTLEKYWEIACQADPQSAGCAFFLRRYNDLLAQVNFHNIHGTCFTDPQISQIPQSLQPKKTEYFTHTKKCQSQKNI